jgi:hypothetical protein
MILHHLEKLQYLFLSYFAWFLDSRVPLACRLFFSYTCTPLRFSYYEFYIDIYKILSSSNWYRLLYGLKL